MKDLSVIIVSYNTKKITRQCLEKLINNLKTTSKIDSEIIVIDNGSKDSSKEMLKKMEKKIKKTKINFKLVLNNKNVGYAKANNQGIAVADGKYILFLNSDVFIENVNFEDLVYYLNKNKNIGALTVKVKLPNGKLDWACHRGFPSLWAAFTYFTKLEFLFRSFPFLSKIFGQYHLTHLDLNTVHEIDSPSGAFYLTRKDILEKVGGFDTRFFMYGEDLDLSYRIKKLNYKIIYYPIFSVIHLKYQSGMKKKSKTSRKKTKEYFYQAMKIFYEKYFSKDTNPLINKLVNFVINLKKKWN